MFLTLLFPTWNPCLSCEPREGVCTPNSTFIAQHAVGCLERSCSPLDEDYWSMGLSHSASEMVLGSSFICCRAWWEGHWRTSSTWIISPLPTVGTGWVAAWPKDQVRLNPISSTEQMSMISVCKQAHAWDVCLNGKEVSTPLLCPATKTHYDFTLQCNAIHCTWLLMVPGDTSVVRDGSEWWLFWGEKTSHKTDFILQGCWIL